MASAFDSIAGLPFKGSGSQSGSVDYLTMVAKVVGEITGDEQLLMIAEQMPSLKPPAEEPPPGAV